MNFKQLMGSRRFLIAVLAIGCLTAIALKNGTDTSMSIASVAIGLSAANSFQKRGAANVESDKTP